MLDLYQGTSVAAAGRGVCELTQELHGGIHLGKLKGDII